MEGEDRRNSGERNDVTVKERVGGTDRKNGEGAKEWKEKDRKDK